MIRQHGAVGAQNLPLPGDDGHGRRGKGARRQALGTGSALPPLPGRSNFTAPVICGQSEKGEIRNDKYLHYLQRLKCHQMFF